MKSLHLIKFIFFCLLINLTQRAVAQTDSLAKYSLTQLEHLFKKERGSRAAIPWIPDMKIALKRAEAEVGTQDTMYAKMLNHLGFAYAIIPEPDQAILYFEQAKKILETHYPQHPLLGTVLRGLAGVYRNLEEFEKAEQLYLQSFKIKNLHFSEYASAMNNLAILYSMIGMEEKAEPMYLEALDLWKKAETQPGTNLLKNGENYANTLQNLAIIYNIKGELEKAETFLLKSIETRVALIGTDNQLHARSLINLANLYSDMGKMQQAEQLFLEVLDIQKRILGEKHPDYIIGLTAFGKMYCRQKKYKEAEYILKDALKRQRNINESPSFARMELLEGLGELYIDKKDYVQAEAYMLQIELLLEQLLGKQNHFYLKILNQHTEILIKTKQYDAAQVLLQQAIAINTNMNLSFPLTQSKCDSLLKIDFISVEHFVKLLALRFEWLAMNSTPIALEEQVLIADLVLKMLERVKNEFSSESDKLRVLEQSSEWVARSLRLLDKKSQLNQAFAVAEQNKSVLLLETIKTERAYSFGGLPDSLARKERKLQDQSQQLRAALAEKRSPAEKDSLRSQLLEVSQKTDALKKRIQQQYPNYFAVKYEHSQTQANDIQALLDDQTALLEYVVTDSFVYIFYLDKQKLHRSKLPIAQDSLRLNIRKLHTALHNYELISKNPKQAYQDYTEIAHWFYQHLVAPVLYPSFGGAGEAKGAKNIKQLIIIPDGELGHLPFETFLVEQAPAAANYSKLHYLVNDYRISYNYSAALWKENLQRPRNKNNGQLLGIAANYAMKLDTTLDERLPVHRNLRKLLNPLPDARKEVEALAQKFTGHFAFDNQASEKEFKKIAAQYGIIHLAMHGLLDNKNPILSSLAFTEDNDSIENNFLQAYEISQLRLNADLVVLSACETGFGKFEKGNGTASLARAFMYAGVPALVVSLWEVNDGSTSMLMQYFYENLQKGQDKAEALRQAKLQYLSKMEGLGGHPAFWSPFVLLGDSRPVEFANSPTWLWRWLGGAVAVLVMLGIAQRFVRKK